MGIIIIIKMKHYSLFLSQILLLLLVNENCGVNASKVLLVNSMGISHIFEMHHIGEELVHRGHQVHSIIQSEMAENIRTDARNKGIGVVDNQIPESFSTFYSPNHAEHMMKSILTNNWDMDRLTKTGNNVCQGFFEDLEMTKWIVKEKFDIAVVWCWYFFPCMMLYPHYLDIPFVCVDTSQEGMITRNPLLPSFVPVVQSLSPKTEDMAFGERLMNLVDNIYLAAVGFPTKTDPKALEMLHKYGKGAQDWQDIYRQMLLFIQTRDHHLDSVAPSMPNIIAVPGVTAKAGKPLPQKLASIVDAAAQGVILMTFGSQISSMPLEIIQKFVDAFRNNPEYVFIMRRMNKKDPLNVPSNVHILDWAPQLDILAHPNTKLFITHCGNNGRYEAAYHGVPMLTMPLFSEQRYNANLVVKKGLGLKLNFKTFTVAELSDSIAYMLNEEKFHANAQKMAAILKNLPMSGAETVAYWIEHVDKNGAGHLRSHAMDMPWYQFIMLDIIAFVTCVIMIVLMCLKCVLRICIKRFCMRSDRKQKQS